MSTTSRRELLAGALGWAIAMPATAAPTPKKERRPFLLFPLWVDFTGIKSRFGSRRIDGKREFHSGVDMGAPYGSPIYAAREGVVSRVGFQKRAGNYIRITHALGWTTVYCHLPDEVQDGPLREGDWIPAWTRLAVVGKSGRTYGPHLHFGLKNPGDSWENPLSFLYTPKETFDILRRR